VIHLAQRRRDLCFSGCGSPEIHHQRLDYRNNLVWIYIIMCRTVCPFPRGSAGIMVTQRRQQTNTFLFRRCFAINCLIGAFEDSYLSVCLQAFSCSVNVAQLSDFVENELHSYRKRLKNACLAVLRMVIEDRNWFSSDFCQKHGIKH